MVLWQKQLVNARAPIRASASTATLPIPNVPPVTTTVLPFISNLDWYMAVVAPSIHEHVLGRRKRDLCATVLL